MDTGKQLFQAIVERPDDDAPRLIYADWLEENGDADQANFIRDQIALANATYDEPARATRDHWEWLAFVDQTYPPQHIEGLPLKEPVGYWRGFLARFTCAGIPKFRKIDDDIFTIAPSVYLKFRFPTYSGEEWVECKYLDRIRGIHVEGTSTSDWTYWVASELLAPKKLRDLRVLSVVRSLPSGMNWAYLVFQCKHLEKMEVLRLEECNLSDVGAIQLGNLTQRDNLKVLSLGNNQITDQSIEVLVTNPGLRNLSELHLGVRQLSERSNVVGQEGIRAIVESEQMANLRVLDLANTSLTEEAVELLADSPFLESLRYLNLSRNDLSARSVEALASSPYAKNLRRLNLEGNDVGDLAVKAILHSPNMANLIELTLSPERLQSQTLAAVWEQFFTKGS